MLHRPPTKVSVHYIACAAIYPDNLQCKELPALSHQCWFSGSLFSIPPRHKRAVTQCGRQVHVFFKTILMPALRQGIIKEVPFKEITYRQKTVEKGFLTKEEMDKLCAAQLSQNVPASATSSCLPVTQGSPIQMSSNSHACTYTKTTRTAITFGIHGRKQGRIALSHGCRLPLIFFGSTGNVDRHVYLLKKSIFLLASSRRRKKNN